MRSWRENPESDANQFASKQHEREVFALQMQATIRECRIVEHCEHEDHMQTPETKAGRLTELVMARVRGKLPELPTHEYNRIYECVLAELSCHVIGETHEIPNHTHFKS